MTDREKAIVMAYTGTCMLTGDKFQIYHKYVEDIMGRPIWTHEIGLLADTIKKKAKADFIALCADESSSEILDDCMVGDMPAQVCDRCNTFYPLAYTGGGHKYCPNYGAKMSEIPTGSEGNDKECKQEKERRKMTELEAMGYTAEQAEEVDRIACSIARTTGIPVDEVTQAICSAIRKLQLLGE